MSKKDHKAQAAQISEVWYRKSEAHKAPELCNLPMSARRISRAIERGELVANKIGNRVYVSSSALAAFFAASTKRDRSD